MDEAQVMTVIRHKSAGDALVKKMVDAAYSIPIRIIRIWLRCNLKMMYLAVDSYLMICDVLQSAFPSKLVCREKVNEPEATVRQEEIVRGIKNLRKSLIVNINQYYHNKFKADNDEAVRRLDKLRNAVAGSKEHEQALKEIKEMNKRFKEERTRIFKEVQELDIDDIIEAIEAMEAMKEDQCEEKDETGKAEHNHVSNLPRKHESLDMNGCYRQLNDDRKNISPRKKNGVSKNRINAKNIKLEQILRVSSNLVEELSKLNQQFSNLTEVNQRMVDMQYELGAERKLLSEVEADRNEMKTKLSTLETLIKEEEKYLDDFSCESGFEENEIPVSP